jgi:glycosyltransferase involved in cell wall biosynthesis
MKKILIYYSNPYRTINIESVCADLIHKKYDVYMLVTCKKGILQTIVEKMGVKVSSFIPNNKNKVLLYFFQIFFLIRFCRRNKIEVVFSHLNFCNLIAVIAQYFIKAKVYPTRHHIDESRTSKNCNAIYVDKLVNLLAKRIIVPSKTAKSDLIRNEGVKAKKIIVIPYGYDFELYPSPQQNFILKEKDKHKEQIILGVILRLCAAKKVEHTILVLEKLLQSNQSAFLYIVSDGPEKKFLENLVSEKKLNKNIEFVGNTDNVINYLSIIDFLLHPSIAESSNQVIKEAGLVNKPVIVCKGIGDFDEYLVDGYNAFLVNKESFVEETFNIIIENKNYKKKLNLIGENLHKTIINRFSINKAMTIYQLLIA